MFKEVSKKLHPVWDRSRRPIWFVSVLLGLIVAFVPVPVRAGPPEERFFRVQASRFEYSPSALEVNPGDRVTVELAAMDVVHGFSLDGYGVRITADPGQPARVSFIADRTGSFRFRCTVPCGGMHPFMIGKLEVGTNDLWWRAAALSVLVLAAGMGLRPT